jgi:hypothetical protein
VRLLPSAVSGAGGPDPELEAAIPGWAKCKRSPGKRCCKKYPWLKVCKKFLSARMVANTEARHEILAGNLTVTTLSSASFTVAQSGSRAGIAVAKGTIRLRDSKTGARRTLRAGDEYPSG